MGLYECTRCGRDDIYRWHNVDACRYTKILADKTTPRLQKFGRRGMFQLDNPKHTAKIMQELLKKK